MDTDNINLSTLWLSRETEQPALEELRLKAERYRRSMTRTITYMNVLLAVTSLFILFIWFHYRPHMITTKIGIIVTILSMAIFVCASNQRLGLFRKANKAASNRQYLNTLLAIREKQQFMQTTLLNLYFIMLSTGIALYIYEYTVRMTTFWTLSAYGATGIWILFNWFYLRPKQIRKQQRKLDGIISSLESILAQLEREY